MALIIRRSFPIQHRAAERRATKSAAIVFEGQALRWVISAFLCILGEPDYQDGSN